MIIFIKNLNDHKIIGSTPKHGMNFISQLKINATTKLAEQWAQRWSGENSPELFTESEVRLISPLSPPKYSDMSPMHEEPLLPQAADEDRGFDEFLTQATSIQRTESLPIVDSGSLPPTIIDTLPTYFDPDNFAQPPPWYTAPQYIEPTSTAVDGNDGPTSFNHSPSILDFTGDIGTKKINKRNAKRKLFQ